MRHIDSTYDTLSYIRDDDHTNTRITFDFKAEFFSFFGFKTSYSKYFRVDTVKTLVSQVDRRDARRRLLHYVKYFVIAEQIEQGIFEFTLETVTAENLPYMGLNIYEDKINDICKNLDIDDVNVQNKTLLPSVMRMGNPFIIAWFAPHQLHPQRWKDLIQKQADAMSMKDNIVTSDLYECFMCHGRKCTTQQIQIRGADEPMAVIITCMICYTVSNRDE